MDDVHLQRLDLKVPVIAAIGQVNVTNDTPFTWSRLWVKAGVGARPCSQEACEGSRWGRTLET